jgi:hypothetical protein
VDPGGGKRRKKRHNRNSTNILNSRAISHLFI